MTTYITIFSARLVQNHNFHSLYANGRAAQQRAAATASLATIGGKITHREGDRKTFFISRSLRSMYV
jgi:hypothetical protein